MSAFLLRDTPVEEYDGIYVKREDLCAPEGAPPFSKIRGLVKHSRKAETRRLPRRILRRDFYPHGRVGSCLGLLPFGDEMSDFQSSV